ncbi:hypothetical protein M9H77_22256 [Catharanthus roseus]|uniref:Uncharacterized protein n=1 Tax=Catharanthus roseus TaxID=4058 RepID=A0ACC0AU05_CATRO|nr:hypothetical protein M9H77_22256 [Catharanthus roseus]
MAVGEVLADMLIHPIHAAELEKKEEQTAPRVERTAVAAGVPQQVTNIGPQLATNAGLLQERTARPNQEKGCTAVFRPSATTQHLLKKLVRGLL